MRILQLPILARDVWDAGPMGELAVVPGGPHDANYTAAEGLAALAVPFLERVAASEPTR